MEGFDHAYIIVDALDECLDRKKLLSWVEELVKWEGGAFHILFSSRPEVDIKEKFGPVTNIARMSLTGSSLNGDIESYVDAMLLEMSRWDNETRARVRKALIIGTDGMWAIYRLIARSD